MSQTDRHAELFLNGRLVGTVQFKGEANSWHFGVFTPHADFTPFAPVFGRWSLLMHADEDSDRLTDAASDELRQTEIEIDRLCAKLHIPATDEWCELKQINIDGELIDWKI
ncbi:MAG: hypothetical protein JWN40_4128 [Phycisphaerales bacterium]|jgi:hypothetical protein|nr:hypothetical protein [Phycisphaerales bacterium]